MFRFLSSLQKILKSAFLICYLGRGVCMEMWLLRTETRTLWRKSVTTVWVGDPVITNMSFSNWSAWTVCPVFLYLKLPFDCIWILCFTSEVSQGAESKGISLWNPIIEVFFLSSEPRRDAFAGEADCLFLLWFTFLLQALQTPHDKVSLHFINNKVLPVPTWLTDSDWSDTATHLWACDGITSCQLPVRSAVITKLRRAGVCFCNRAHRCLHTERWHLPQAVWHTVVPPPVLFIAQGRFLVTIPNGLPRALVSWASPLSPPYNLLPTLLRAIARAVTVLGCTCTRSPRTHPTPSPPPPPPVTRAPHALHLSRACFITHSRAGVREQKAWADLYKNTVPVRESHLPLSDRNA
jgi:hypothetical protein